MMIRVFTKMVVTGLLILGEGAFASESNGRGDGRYEANVDAVQLSQPAFQNEIGSMWQPSLAGINTMPPNINLTYHTSATVTVPASESQKYHPVNPRAPPVPAS